jgi:hypothetical protein
LTRALPSGPFDLAIESVTNHLHETDLTACPIELYRGPVARSGQINNGDLHTDGG